MGFRVTIGDQPFEASSFSVEEASTPLAGNDTTGQVGTLSFDIQRPDPDLPRGFVEGPPTPTNLFTNPSAEVNDNGYARIGSAAGATPVSARVADASDPSGGSYIARITYPSDQTGRSGLGFFIGAPGYSTVSGGGTYSMGAWFRSSWAASLSVELRGYNGSSGVATGPAGNIDLPPGVWVWVQRDGLVLDPSGTNVRLIARTRSASDQAPAGGTLDCGGVMLNEGPETLSYGDGSRTPGWGWSGAEDASTSGPISRVPGTDPHPIIKWGPEWLIDQDLVLRDSRKGFTLGTVTGITDRNGGTFSVTATGDLGRLNVYGVQSQPFVGTLEAAFTYYAGLAGINTDLWVDESIRNQPVVFPGWFGELWFNMKQMAAALDCDISLVSGVILLRPIRAREATQGRDLQKSRDVDRGTLAQYVEVYRYDNKAITNQMVYPPNGWTPEVEIISVEAGETIEQSIDLSASVSSITQPTPQLFVSQEHDSSSVYTIVGDDGLPIPPQQWLDKGGSLEVSINPDTTSLTVKITGAVDIAMATGEFSKTYSIALASDTSGNRYSTLRIMGSGVSFNKQSTLFPTTVPPEQAPTEIGVTIDNPFLSTIDELYRVGTRTARQYAGYVPGLTASVVSVNRRGDSGDASYPTYAEVKSELISQGGAGVTYSSVDGLPSYSGQSYSGVQDYWFEQVQGEFENQTFGNVAGARIYDPKSRRYYRIRSATLNPSTIEISTADDDLTHADMELLYFNDTYGQVNAMNAGMTYRRSMLAGMHRG